LYVLFDTIVLPNICIWLFYSRPKQKWKPPKKAKKDDGGSSSKKRRLDLHQPEIPLSKEQLSMDEAFALQLLRGK